ncbi:sensor histidine kinase [Nonomuraea sp. NPDC050547]|uniref:sensor histidine kinase n=1 Tax=Nonomuraea sp. NPDC050547 TaxID=3364368 RepID=UPI0037897F68
MGVKWGNTHLLGDIQLLEVEVLLAVLLGLTMAALVVTGAHCRLKSGAMLRERSRIARDLHDGVGHGLVVIAFHARQLATALPSARCAADVIDSTAQATLAELRGALGSLRAMPAPPPGGEPGLVAPSGTPLAVRLAELTDRAPEGQLTLVLENLSSVKDVGADVEHTAFRVAQEALTNALKHADGPILLSASIDHCLTVEVISHGGGGPKAVPPEGGGGTGLEGLRRRVAEHGGVLESSPLAGGGFAVRALLPLEGGHLWEDRPCERSAS